ncbi:unnamed protein product [Effrenium voratum]|uniref:Poly [ADP-ribose] polymerase n=1 Tax=Effrenium voratum TaxID=2562239 RepID=A0AA36JD90_9DINO|nr:unnamed protein product [Effrenium voratum]
MFGYLSKAMDSMTREGVDALRAGVEDFKDDVSSGVMSLADSPSRVRSLLTRQMDDALARHDSHMVNQLLDNAMANHLMGPQAPSIIRSAAQQQAKRQLRDAIDSADSKRLKGALVAAKRLNATELPEFTEAIEKYKAIRKLPVGWDVNLMVLNREGARMVAQLQLDDPSVCARFQRLLDLTHRKVYTRDRMGQPVPERLRLLTVAAVTNDESWGNYAARREAIRREIDADISGYTRYDVDTMARSSDAESDAGESAESIALALADEDFASPLMQEVNEVFLFHGTSAANAEKIKTHDFRINLAGSNAGSLYGRGIYLAENCTKSDEYTSPLADGVRHLLVCRVALGRVHYTDAKEDADPRGCEDACLKGKYHSILGDRKKCRGTFREFVVFDEEQTYVNYILTYRREDP